MHDTKQLLSEKKAITPLWIVALFVSLTELVLGVAVTQTVGGIQVSLTVFVIAFPTLVAGAFFITLWHKPYVFYPPTEFGSQVAVGDYVEAMQRRPGFFRQSVEHHNLLPLTETEKQAAGIITDSFLLRLSHSALVALWAFSIAYSKRKMFNLKDFCFALGFPNTDYEWAVINVTASAGLIEYEFNGDVIDIKNMNEKLILGLRPEIERRMKETSEEDLRQLEIPDLTKEGFKIWLQGNISKIEQYFG